MDFIDELQRITGSKATVEHWTVESAQDDFWCPLDEEEVVQIHELLENNLDQALVSDIIYIRTFAELIRDSGEDFLAGQEELQKALDEGAPQDQQGE